jgi:hypothetical protein
MKTYTKKQIKEDYFLVEKTLINEILYSLFLAFIIFVLIFGLVHAVAYVLSEQYQKGYNEGRWKATNEIIELAKNTPCGENIIFKDNNQNMHTFKKIECYTIGAFELVPYYKNLSLGGFK